MAQIPAGTVFGQLIVTGSRLIRGKEGYYPCCCACGVEKLVRGVNLTRGLTKSCGCLSATLSRKRMTSHGKSFSREYQCFMNMWRRCTEPTHNRYKHYGGRGVVVDPCWMDFEKFFEDMGPCKDGETLDRIDSNKGTDPITAGG